METMRVYKAIVALCVAAVVAAPVIVTVLTDTAPDPMIRPDSGADATKMGGKMKTSFTSANDPNNCGDAGIQCGTWKIVGTKVQLTQTACIESVCFGGINCTPSSGCCYTPDGVPPGTPAIPILPGNEVCPVDGGQVCTNVTLDSANCGACGVVCATPLTCKNGLCS
jgi:hypothetical protein